MQRVKRIPALVRELGVPRLLSYARYQLIMRSGMIRVLNPATSWEARPLQNWLLPGTPIEPGLYARYHQTHAGKFFWDSIDSVRLALKQIPDDHSLGALAEADAIRAGSYRIFGIPAVPYGFPPDWNSYLPLAEVDKPVAVPAGRHWSLYDLATLPYDVKLIWEPGRFGWVFPLARAYVRSGNDVYYQAFMRLLHSWMEQNPPNCGLHWYTAQAAALRILAVAFALHAFAPVLEQRPQDVQTLVLFLAVHADRIPVSMMYARSQGNNHLLTEAAGLYTVGVLLPDLRKAAAWKRLGRKWLEQGFREQIGADGGYAQHSANYQRLALYTGLWVLRLGEVNAETFSPGLYERLARMSANLRAMQDPVTGQVPNFGANDGAHILPLSSCSQNDFRPVLELADTLLSGRADAPQGCWDETSVWFGFSGRSTLRPPAQTSLGVSERTGEINRPIHAVSLATRDAEDYPRAGMYFMRAQQSWSMLRSVRFKHRPGHSDQMHLDLWWRGENLAMDAGTYLYNGAAPWENGLTGAAVHNTVLVDNREPMQRAGKFLWTNWSEAYLLGRWESAQGSIGICTAEQNGYRSLGVIHRRTVVRVQGSFWLIADDLLPLKTRRDERHVLRLNWLLPDADYQVYDGSITREHAERPFKLAITPADATMRLFRAGVQMHGPVTNQDYSVLGWVSKTYAQKQPAVSVTTEVEAELPFRFISTWQLGDSGTLPPDVSWVAPGKADCALKAIEFCGITWKPESIR